MSLIFGKTETCPVANDIKINAEDSKNNSKIHLTSTVAYSIEIFSVWQLFHATDSAPFDRRVQ
jgi:hypothetical protein